MHLERSCVLCSKMEVAELLAQLGDPGLYQILLYICLFVCNSTVSMNHLIMAIYGYTPKHSCTIPDGVLKNNSIPTEIKDGKTSFEKCKAFLNFNATFGSKMDCPNGWTFDISGKESSIVDEWSLVCDEKYKVSAATTIYFAGVMIGGAIFGQLADKFGRKPVLLVCLYGHILLGVGVHFASSYDAFVAIRFFLGFLVQGIQTSSYVLLVEMTVVKYRPICAGIFEVCWAVGNLWMTSLAWAIQDWRKIQLALCLPSLITLFYIIFVPESIRWLVNQGKNEQAEHHARRIARFNKKELPNELNLYAGSKAVKIDGRNYSFHDLFINKEIRKRTMLMGYIWLASSVGYYGLILTTGGLAGNRYANYFVSASVEVIAFISVIFVLKYLTRRRPLMLYYILGGVTCIIAGTIKKSDSIDNNEDIATVFAVIGKFFLSAGFSTIFLFTVELFPTVVRTLGMGSCVFWARVGGMVAPQILLIGDYTFDELPYLIFGGLALLAAVATYFVPETRGQHLPETIEEFNKDFDRENGNTHDSKL